MSNARIWIYAVVLFLTAGTILITQVSWILQAAEIEERLVNQRVNHALCMALEELSTDKAMCSNIAKSCVAKSADSFDLRLAQNDRHTIDSVIKTHLIKNQIDVPFRTSFQPVIGSNLQSGILPNQAFLYPKNPAQADNVLVQLDIPSRNDLIWAQINSTFLLSVAMLLVLSTLFIGALRSLLRERAIRLETVDILNSMAHDLKTPISNLSLAVTMLRKNHSVGSQGEAYLDILDSEIVSLKSRSGKVLGAASLDILFASEAERREVDLHEIIRGVVRRFDSQVNDRGGSIICELEAGPAIIDGHFDQLQSSFTNIIDNALTYASTAPEVTIGSSREQNTLQIDIRDNGPGIAKDEQALIFRKGYRSRTAYQTDGSGLGLYLAKTIIERHNGTLSLFSDGKAGSTFTIRFNLTK